MATLPNEITELLWKWGDGDISALDELTSLVYPELRRLARNYMGRENPGHTLQTSALINEAYIRLIQRNPTQWSNRGHFFAVAAQVMRHILVDHARRHGYSKRGGGAQHIELDETAVVGQQRASEFVALDDALTRLAALDPRKSRIVELRFFGGLTVDEIAGVLDVSPITVKREWRAAKAWLYLDMNSGSNETEPNR